MRTTLAQSASPLSLTAGQWYTGKVVVDDDGSGGQRLRFWVDTDQDGDFSDETVLITSTAVDDDWSGGQVGLFRSNGYGVTHQYDDVTVWLDNDANGTLDSGDSVQVADDFSSGSMTLTYDTKADRGGRAKGNLTSDGLLHYVYDGWNRLAKAQRVAAHGASNDTTTIATYRYLADNRRASKVVENCGLENVASDGGDTTTHFYYGGVAAGLSTGRWNVFETRNGSNQATRQWVYGTQYVDEILLMDVNGDPATDNDCDQDVLTRLEDQACQAPCEGGDGDRRYFYVQDRNWNVVALTAYCSPGLGCNTSNATIVERYSFTPYGEFVVLGGAGDSGEWANARATSGVGNIFFHQGLPLDQEKGSYQNRWREYANALQCFAQPDPLCPHAADVAQCAARLGEREGLSTFVRGAGNPTQRQDPLGLCTPPLPSFYCDVTIWVPPGTGRPPYTTQTSCTGQCVKKSPVDSWCRPKPPQMGSETCTTTWTCSLNEYGEYSWVKDWWFFPTCTECQ